MFMISLQSVHLFYWSRHKQNPTKINENATQCNVGLWQLIEFDYHAHLVSKAGFLISGKSHHLLSNGAAITTVILVLVIDH